MGECIVEDGQAKVLKLASPESFETDISLESTPGIRWQAKAPIPRY